jgi:formylglycine-generating enzyme required for sulfatase activity
MSSYPKVFVFVLVSASLAFYACDEESSSTGIADNHPPVIQDVTANPDSLLLSQTTDLQCLATDEDQDSLTFVWASSTGSFPGGNEESEVQWQSPDAVGDYYVRVSVGDGIATVTDSVLVVVSVPENNAPVIVSISADPALLQPAALSLLTCEATDPDGDDLAITWSSSNGDFPGGNIGDSVQWQAPDISGTHTITVTVDDGQDTTSDSVEVVVNAAPDTPSNPAPTTWTEVPTTGVILSWDCSDPEGDTLFYDLYLGITPSPPLMASNLNENTFNPGEFESEKIYHWRVVARDHLGNETTGPAWAFITTNAGEFELGDTGVSIEMAYIEPGTHWMGQPYAVGAGDDEWPRHEVTFDYGFWIGKFEITQQQFEAVMGSWNFAFPGNPNRPAENVSWNDAQNFIAAINATEPGNPWRLPTESEWEYACLAGHDTERFWWGNDLNYAILPNYGWYDTNSGGQTHNAGSTIGDEPNPWGIWDMHGNVWEWCQDWYHENYVGKPTDGSAWEDPPGTMRVFRGGSWYNPARQCMSTLRSMWYPNQRVWSFGFRLVRDE